MSFPDGQVIDEFLVTYLLPRVNPPYTSTRLAMQAHTRTRTEDFILTSDALGE